MIDQIPPYVLYSAIILAVVALLAYAIDSLQPFGRASHCRKKKSFTLEDGTRVLLLEPDANMTVPMIRAYARGSGYDIVGEDVLRKELAPRLAGRRWFYQRVIGLGPNGAVWALDAHDERLSQIDPPSDCEGCLVAVSPVERSKAEGPATATA